MERATQMFVQGTTPTHTFRLSIDTDSITQVRISYAQAAGTLTFHAVYPLLVDVVANVAVFS